MDIIVWGIIGAILLGGLAYLFFVERRRARGRRADVDDRTPLAPYEPTPSGESRDRVPERDRAFRETYREEGRGEGRHVAVDPAERRPRRQKR